MLDANRTTELIFGERGLEAYYPEIRQLRMRCGQEDDLTTDPQYFIAVNTLKGRRVAAVLIRVHQKLEGCVLFYEYWRFGIGLGLVRLGDYLAESLLTGPEDLRVQHVYLAAHALLRHWRIHGVSIAMKVPLDDCLEVMGA